MTVDPGEVSFLDKGRGRRKGSATTPPHSIEAEQATLGSLLIDSSAWTRISGMLASDASDFFRADHRMIFGAVATLAKAGLPHDVILVSEELKRTGQLEDCGGLVYLAELARNTATSANVAAYAGIVRDRAVLRDLQHILADVDRAIADGGRAAEIITTAVTGLARIKPAQPSQTDVECVLASTDFSQMQAHLTDAHLIKGFISPGSLVGIIGASGSGKTFLATDIATHLAANREWCGRRTAGGLLLYCALEGPRSAENRFVACRDHRGFDGGIPLLLTPGPLNLRHAEDVAALVSLVKHAETSHGEKCVAVFVDTLSRAMAGGDENSSECMTALVAGADAIRLQTGAAVILVHHLGKDEGRGARGHSSLKAALDTEIEVSLQGDVHVATVTKQRDMVTGGRFAFRLPVIELGLDVDGDPVTTCYVEPVDAPPVATPKAGGKHQVALLAALSEWHRTHPDGLITSIEIRELAKTQKLPRQRFAEVVETLSRIGYLCPSVGGFRFTPEDR